MVKGSWYEAGVTFVTEKGLFQGTSEGMFSPNTNMTRAMLMTVLARMDAQDTEGGDTWYDKAMAWAKTQGISDGSRLESDITRQELAVMLYRYAKTLGKDNIENGTEILRFADTGDVADWAKEAMTWAVSAELIHGTSESALSPGKAPRAEVP